MLSFPVNCVWGVCVYVCVSFSAGGSAAPIKLKKIVIIMPMSEGYAGD